MTDTSAILIEEAVADNPYVKSCKMSSQIPILSLQLRSTVPPELLVPRSSPPSTPPPRVPSRPNSVCQNFKYFIISLKYEKKIIRILIFWFYS